MWAHLSAAVRSFECAYIRFERCLGDVCIPLPYRVPEKGACGLVDELTVMHVEDDPDRLYRT